MSKEVLSKVLVCGNVEGRWSLLFDRVKQVNAKNGPFQLLIVAGDFFGDAKEVNLGPSPIPTLILGPTGPTQLEQYPDINGCEIGENITYMGRCGVYNEATGLKIAYLSGRQYDGPSDSKPQTDFNFEDVKNLRVRLENEGNFRGVDILVTHAWPKGVENLSSMKPEGREGSSSPSSSSLLASLAKAIKPRYHFAGIEDISYERVPYRNHQVLAEQAQHPSRFISLGAVGGKKKWIYAFNISPMCSMSKEQLLVEPPSITPNPYVGVGDSSSSSGGGGGGGAGDGNMKTASSQQFFYDSSYTGAEQRGGRGARGGRGRGGKRGPQGSRGDHPNGKMFRGEGGGGGALPPSACWFCLASPEVEKHLVLSIGEAAYVTLAKGGLTLDHLLILPIGHYGSMVEAPKEVVDEIEKYKKSISAYFQSIGKAPIFFERNFKSPHLQVQAVPLDKELLTGLKINCIEFAESEGVELEEFPPSAQLYQMTRPGFPYFVVELPDGLKLFTSIKGSGFPLQFGRELLCSDRLLNCPEKVDWKECKLSKEEETRATQQMRNSFKPFDFTL